MANMFFPDDNLFDSHCHLNDKSFYPDIEGVVSRSNDAGVSKIIDIGIDLESSRQAIGNAQKFPGIVYASVGLDPDLMIPNSELFVDDKKLLNLNYYDAEDFIEKEMIKVADLINQNRDYVVAIGESGMDAYWVNRTDKKFAEEQWKRVMSLQRIMFRKHLELSVETKLPLTIHSRACEEDCLRIVLDYPQARGVFHSYTGSYETAKKVLDAGWSLGVNGIITFKSAQELRAMYKKILGAISSDAQPADFYAKGIYFETDAPYLSPEGKRGERNEPAAVAKVWEKLLIL